MVRFDVVTFGSGVVDVFASTEIGEKKGKLDLEVGSKYLIDSLRVEVGGGATNTAVGFSRFGLKTGCVCGVGEDDNSKLILDCLKKEKISFLGKRVAGSGVRKIGTGYSMVVDSKKKNRTILTYKGASNEVRFEDIRKFKSKWIYFTSLLGKSFLAQKKLANKFVASGGKLAFNPSSYFVDLVGSGKYDIKGLLKLCSVLVLNKEEAEVLCKKYKKKGDLLDGLRSLGPKIVVITDKDKKILCCDGDDRYDFMPNKGKKVVERTGAGDAFGAGFVAGLVREYPIQDCLKLAVEESEAVLGYFGAKNNLLKRKL